MTLARHTEFEILEATARTLEEQGYDVIREPSPSLLPETLRAMRPDAIAIGRDPKLVVEVAQETAHDANRVAKLQQALKLTPEWKLHLVVGFATASPDVAMIDLTDISKTLDRAEKLAAQESQAALLMAWAALEALARTIMPKDFARPQSPGRIIERMASEGIVTPSEAAFMRHMAATRNTYIHGGLGEAISEPDVIRFLGIVRGLISATVL
jgi:hypothetical protein